MSTHPVLAVVIRCDSCQQVLLEPQSDHAMLWRTRDDAIACLIAVWGGEPSWEFSASLAGPDRCPACLCARDGHYFRPDPPDHPRPFRWCARCGAFAINPAAIRPCPPDLEGL